MKRRYFCILAMSLAIMTAFAQQEDMDEACRIKLSSDYYWEEGTADSADEAFAQTTGQLLNSLRGKGLTFDSLEVMREARRIDTPRGTRTRVMVYCEKAAIQRLNSAPSNVVSRQQASQHGATSVVDEQMVERIRQSANFTAPETRQDASTASTAPLTSLAALASVGYLQLVPTLQLLRKQGVADDYGKVGREDIPLLGDAYLVLVDVTAETVRGVLTPETDGARRNVVSGRPDTTSNYRGCRAMWVRTK